jgi:RNA polymerase sigma-70 factor (ECF subfamily)
MSQQAEVYLEEFERTALPFADQLFRVALRIVREHSQAEDLVQEALLQAWRSFDRFQPGTNLRAWLFKILFNVHYSRFRRRLELLPLEDNFAETLVFDPPTPQYLTEAEVLDALKRLPRIYQLPLVLADIEELSYKEIAQALSLPLGTVMSRLHRGRKLLRANLALYAHRAGFITALKEEREGH